MLLEHTHCNYNVCLLYFGVSAVGSVFAFVLQLCIAMACASTMQCLDLYVAFHCIAVTPLQLPVPVSQ